MVLVGTVFHHNSDLVPFCLKGVQLVVASLHVDDCLRCLAPQDARVEVHSRLQSIPWRSFTQRLDACTLQRNINYIHQYIGPTCVSIRLK